MLTLEQLDHIEELDVIRYRLWKTMQASSEGSAEHKAYSIMFGAIHRHIKKLMK